jgi:hypothetical protein
MKKRQVRVDIGLEQLVESGALPASVETEDELARFLVKLTSVLNKSTRLGAQFMTDPVGFCENAGIKMGALARDALRSIGSLRAPKIRYPTERADAPPVIRRLTFRVKPEVAARAKRSALKPHRMKGIEQEHVLELEPPPEPRRPRKTQHRAALSAPTTDGWDVALQLRETLYRDFFRLHFFTQFYLWPLNPDAMSEPTFTYNGSFFAPFRIDLAFPQADGLYTTPRFKVQGAPPHSVDLELELDCTLRYPADAENASQFRATVNKRGQIRRGEQDFFVDFTGSAWDTMTVQIDADVDGAADVALQYMVTVAAQRYFESEFPTLPLMPPFDDALPFMTFATSGMSSVDGSGGNNAVTLAFGLGPNATFDTYIIPANRNVTYGMSRGVCEFFILRNVPDLPATQDLVTINTADVTLRQGFIEITGDGSFDVPNLFEVGFDYEMRLGLRVHGGGRVEQRVLLSDVDLPDWLQVLAVIVIGQIGFLALGPDGATLGLTALAVAEGLMGAIAADGIEPQEINIEETLEERLNFDLILGELRTEVKEAEITPNGIFFHGEMHVDYEY